MPRAGAASAAAAARQARQRKANRPEYRPEELLADEALVQTTRFSSLKPQPTGRGRERHDLCVLLQQQKAAYKGLFRTDLQATDGSGSPGAFAQDSSFTEVPPECSSTVHGEAAAAREVQTSTELALQISTFSETESNEGWPLRRKCGVSLWVLVPEDIPEMPRTVFFCVSESNPVRWACIRLALSPWFDWAVLFVICTSSMMMALDAPGVGPELKRVIVYCDELTLYIFTMEMLVKVLAFGLWCGRGTYLTNSWNRLDALVVFSGWISLITSQQGECDVFGLFFCAESSSGGANFNSIRTVRVLRPLKAMNQLPGMKALVTTLLTSLPDLMDSMILCGFCLVLFGIIGVQLFMGCLRQVCMPSADSVTTLPPSSWGYKDVGLGSLCSLDHHGNGHCVEGFTCVADAASNPNGGVTSFDSLPFAMLAVFQSITLEGWVDIMYDIRKVKHLFNDAYFIGLILFGSLFMTNLVVGVLVSNFIDASAAATVVDADGEPVEEAKTSSVLVREYIQKMEPSMLCIFRRYCFKLSSSERFNYAMITLIALNTLTLALDNIISDDVLEIFNVVFTILFTLEMLIKIIGFGPKLYSLDGFNNFDFVIVVFSLVELVISRTMGMAGGGSLTALRTFRLLRVFKLARSMKSLRKILDAVMGSLGAIGHLGVLLGMFMFVCALTGMASYGTTEEELQDPEGTGQRWTLEEDGYYRGRMTRPNFSTFLYSMTTVFIIITGENWNEVMYTSVQKNGWSSALYFILIMLIGNYIILNLFLAILIQKFDSGADDGADDKVSEAEDHPARQQSYCSNSTSSSFMYSLQNNVGPKRKKSLGSLPEELDPGAGIVRPSLLGEGSLSRMSFPEIVDDGASGVQNLEPVEGGNGIGPRGAEPQPQVGLDDRTASFSSSGKGSDLAVASPGVVRERAVSFDEADRGVVREREVSFDDGGSENIGVEIESMKKTFTSSGTTFEKKSTPSGTTSGAIRDIISSQGFHCSECFGIGWAKALRQRLLHNVLQNPWFDETIYGLIAVSAIILAMESPDQEDPEMKHTFFVFDCVLSTLFTLEAILKIFVHGFICGPSSYLRNSWNVLDLFVVITSLINITLTQLSSGGHSRSFAWVKGLRALRALRPLRMVSRSEGLKVVVDSLFQAAPSIRDVTLVLMLFLTIFSILGVQLFKNKFNRCSCLDFCPEKSFKPGSEAARGKPIERICEGSCPGAPPHLQTCLWERHPRWSFDNVFRAFLTLFEVCTLELWMDVMWLAVDGKSPDEAPEYNNSPIAVLFFILFLFIMSFFILNLFVGVVIDKFSSVRNEMLGFTIFSERQMHWITTQRMLMKMKPRPLLIVPDNKWRQAAMQLIALPEFEQPQQQGAKR